PVQEGQGAGAPQERRRRRLSPSVGRPRRRRAGDARRRRFSTAPSGPDERAEPSLLGTPTAAKVPTATKDPGPHGITEDRPPENDRRSFPRRDRRLPPTEHQTR